MMTYQTNEQWQAVKRENFMRSIKPKGARYYCNCVNWPQDDVRSKGGLSDMIEGARTITRRTFLKRVNRDDLREIEKGFGYDRHPRQGLTMAGDWAVNYSRSKLHGKTVYFFTHSAIEYVFT